jgi:hypothetical protein
LEIYPWRIRLMRATPNCQEVFFIEPILDSTKSSEVFAKICPFLPARSAPEPPLCLEEALLSRVSLQGVQMLVKRLLTFATVSMMGLACVGQDSQPGTGGGGTSGGAGTLGSAGTTGSGAAGSGGQKGSAGVTGATGIGGATGMGGTTGAGGADGTGATGGSFGGAGLSGTAGRTGGGAGTAGASAGSGGRGSGAGGSVGLGGSTGGGGTAGTGTAGTIGAAGTTGTTTGGSSGTTCTSEDCGTACTVPALPAYSAITATNAKLPDPFLMLSGTRMTSLSQWECRRAELNAEFQTYELGQKNPKPAGTVTGSMSGSTLTVSVGGKSFTVTITLPTTGTAPYPAIIALDGGSLPSSQIEGLGVAMISMSTMTLGDQTGASSRGNGFFFTVNGADNGAGSLVAWAWGASRVIDALAVTPAAKIDPTRIGVTGCSRNGKGALVMGALDERVKLTIVQESGSGGTASWRVSDNEDGGKNIVQTLGEIVGEDDWFSSTLTQFANAHAATKLPEDHHELLGMVAPRGLFVIENTQYQWLGVNSCVTDATAAQMIFQGLGVKDNMAFEQHGHAHCAFDSAEWPDLEAYIKKFLLNQNVTASAWNVTSTQFGSTTSTLNIPMWVDWTVPTLN